MTCRGKFGPGDQNSRNNGPPGSGVLVQVLKLQFQASFMSCGRGGWNWSREIVNKLARYAFQACDHEVGASVSSSSLAVVALLHPD